MTTDQHLKEISKGLKSISEQLYIMNMLKYSEDALKNNLCNLSEYADFMKSIEKYFKK